MRKMAALVVLFALAAVVSSAVAAPVVFWAGDPVKPGETVMLVGEGFGHSPRVEVWRWPDISPDAPPVVAVAPQEVGSLQADAQCVKFVIPATLQEGVFGYRVTGLDGGVTGDLNRPVAWWVQGDAGPVATPGGRLRALGKNLGWSEAASGAKTTFSLMGPQDARLAAKAEPYSAEAELPADLPPGDYTLRIHNGLGGPGAWSDATTVRVEPAQAWPQAVYDVRDYGATGTGVGDDTEAIEQALQAAGNAGGGIVHLPRGRYQVSEGLKIPRFTVLRGEGRDLTCLQWPDTAKPPTALIEGTNSFGVQDLTLYCSNHLHVIAGDLGDQPDAGNVRLLRLRVRANAYMGHLTPEQVDERFQASLKLSTGGGDTVRLGGRNLEISGCDLYGTGRCLYLSRARGAWVHDNTFYNGRWGWYCISGSDGLVLENNQIIGGDLQSTGGGLNCLDGSTCSQNVYYARNKLSLMHGWDREAMTSDAGGGAYLGSVVSVEGTTTTLSADPEEPGRDWAGAGIFILDGTGRGQYRQIVRIEGRNVVTDSPWAFAPDATSVVSITMLQRHYLFVGNEFSDAGVALQLYGMAIEDIADGNRSTRTAGMHNFGMRYGGIQPSWYIQWLNNEIAEGNSYRSGHDNHMLGGEAHLGIFALPPGTDFQHCLTLGCVARRNRLLNNAHIAVGGSDPYSPAYTHPNVQEVVVEGNEISRSDMGVHLRRASSGVVIRENRFTDVKQETVDEMETIRAAQQRLAELLTSGNPLAVWSFEELKGQRVPDVTGNGFNAQVSGELTLEEGKRGTGGRLGDGSFLRVDDPSVYNLVDVTLAAWIKPDTTEGRHGLIGKRFAGTTAPFVFSLWDGGLEFEATDATGKWSFNFRTPAGVKEGEWNHVAVAVKQGTGVTIYLDGQEIATKANTLERVMNGEPLIIGREAWSGVNMVHEPCFFSGVLDEVKVWGRALSAGEIRSDYEGQ